MQYSNNIESNFEQDTDYDKHAEHVGFVLGYFSIREEWDTWARKNKLTAKEAIPLMNGLDPQSWKEYKKEKRELPLEMIQSIQRCLEVAEYEKFNIASPTEWLIWGCKHDLDKPILRSNEKRVPDICMFELFGSAVNEASGLPIKNNLGRRDRQIDAILLQINNFDYACKSIPFGGKSAIKKECMKNKDLFTDSGFDHAWNEAKKRRLIEVENVEIYK